MGERLLDELARALAEPVPRRRALQLLGAALAAVSFPGAARAAGVGQRSAADPICPDMFNCGSNACCPPQRCEKDVDGKLKCLPCPKGRKCRSHFPTQCCPARSVCCHDTSFRKGDPRYEVCCKLPNTCRNGCRCPNGRKSCGGTACCSASQRCTVCYRGLASDERIQSGVKCCPPDVLCCEGRCCKSSDESCCGAKCCPGGTFCAGSGDGRVCCPAARTLTAFKRVCCPPGTEATAEGCCPPGQLDCCPPSDGGGNVLDCSQADLICVRGVCVKP